MRTRINVKPTLFLSLYALDRDIRNLSRINEESAYEIFFFLLVRG